jgi:hypothetical protein
MRQSSSSRFCVEVREPQESLPGQQKLDSRFCVEVPRASVGVDWQLDSTTTDGLMGTVASGTKSAAKNVASGTKSVVKKVASGTKSLVGTVAAKTKSMVGLNNIRLNFVSGCDMPETIDKWTKIDKTKNIIDQINESFSKMFKAGSEPWGDVCVVWREDSERHAMTKELCPRSRCLIGIKDAEERPNTSEVWLEVTIGKREDFTWVPENKIKVCVVETLFPRSAIYRGDVGWPKRWYVIDKSESIYDEIHRFLRPDTRWVDMHVIGPGYRDPGLTDLAKYKKWDVSTGLFGNEFDVACKKLIANAGRPESDIWLRVMVENVEKARMYKKDEVAAWDAKQDTLTLEERKKNEIQRLSYMKKAEIEHEEYLCMLFDQDDEYFRRYGVRTRWELAPHHGVTPGNLKKS